MFNKDLKDTFVTFSIYHFIPVMIIFLIILLIILNKDRIRHSKYFNHMRIGLAVLILLQELALNIYRISFNEWKISTSLPLQLCGIAVLTTAFILITKNEVLFKKVIFIMFIGATLALITPGIEDRLGYPHFRYFQFFVSHGLIVINITFLLFVMDYQRDIKYVHLFHNFVSLIALALVMLLVNIMTGGNYMYLMAKPGEGTAFDLFGSHPWYIINILIFGIPIFFHLFYFPFFVRNRVFRNKQIA